MPTDARLVGPVNPDASLSDLPIVARRGLLVAGAALGGVALTSGPAAALQDAEPRDVPAVPGAAGGGLPRLVDVDIDGIAGAGDPAPDGLELIAALDGPLLVGVTVSAEGRVFLNWPRWGDTVEFTVDEVRVADGEGRVYLTAYESGAILFRLEDGTIEELVADPRLLWPDTMSLAPDGYLYVTTNQLHRQPRYHVGVNLRRAPYALFRFPVDATPVRLS